MKRFQLILMFILGLSLPETLKGQNIVVSSSSTSLYSSETSDCNGSPNNYIRGRVRLSTGNLYPEYNANNVGGGTWHSNTSATGTHTTPYNSSIQITSWGYEDDGGICGGDDGVCAVDWNYNTSYILNNYIPCTNHNMEHLRNCSGITWGARATFNWQYDASSLNNSHSGSVSGTSGTYCSGYNPANIANASNASIGYGSYQWERSVNGGVWSNVGGASSTSFDPPALTSTTAYRRKYVISCTNSGTVNIYSNAITYTIVPDPSAPTLNTATPASGGVVPEASDVTATITAGANGIGCVEEYRYSIDGGTTWSSYSSGGSITVGVEGTQTIVQARRNCSGTACDAQAYSTIANWTVGAPLPVEMTYFYASITENQKVLLDWETATEINNEGFAIERSKDGKNFVQIGYIKGNGNSNELNAYQYEDRNVIAGTYYYRLKQIDFDGKFEYSNIKSATIEGVEGIALSAFIPNPAKNITKLELNLIEQSNVTIHIFDNLGRIVERKSYSLEAGTQKLDFDLATYQQGVYVAKIQVNNENYVRKLIVE